MGLHISFYLYDGRYYTNPDRAIVYEVCESLKEANDNKDEYGTDTAIVKTWSKKTGERQYEIVRQKLINTTNNSNVQNKSKRSIRG